MLKSLLSSIAIFSIALICAGCMSAYVPNGGYSAAYPAVIYTNETHPSFVGERVENLSGVEILGNVKGSASASNVLLIVSLGNNSIEKAKAEEAKRLEQERLAEIERLKKEKEENQRDYFIKQQELLTEIRDALNNKTE